MKNLSLLVIICCLTIDVFSQCTEDISMIIPPVCESKFGTQIQVEPQGGEFLDFYVSDDGTISHDLGPGVYTARYQYTFPSGCDTILLQTFEVHAPPDFQFYFDDSFNCGIEDTLFMDFWTEASFPWLEQNGESLEPGDFGFYEITSAHPIELSIYNSQIACEHSIEIEVPSYNQANIELVSCSDCTQEFTPMKVCIEGADPGSYFGLTDGNFGYGVPGHLFNGGTYTAYAFSPNGCVSTDVQVIPENTDAVPQVSAGSSLIKDCTVGAGQLLGAYDQNSDISILWTTDNGVIKGDPTVLAPLIEKTGKYYLHGTHNFTGCVGTDSTYVQAGQNAVNIETENIVLTDAQQNLYAIFVSLSGGTAPYSTKWYFEGQVISEEEDLINVPPGEYKLEVTDANDFCVINENYNLTLVATDDIPTERALMISPNPFSELIDIRLPEGQELRDLRVYNTQGQLLLQQNKFNRQSIDLGHLSIGQYILHITTDTQVFSKQMTRL